MSTSLETMELWIEFQLSLHSQKLRKTASLGFQKKYPTLGQALQKNCIIKSCFHFESYNFSGIKLEKKSSPNCSSCIQRICNKTLKWKFIHHPVLFLSMEHQVKAILVLSQIPKVLDFSETPVKSRPLFFQGYFFVHWVLIMDDHQMAIFFWEIEP